MNTVSTSTHKYSSTLAHHVTSSEHWKEDYIGHPYTFLHSKFYRHSQKRMQHKVYGHVQVYTAKFMQSTIAALL
jgi:hypothetical protein